MEYSTELKALKNDFESTTGMKVSGIEENRTFFHWKRLMFDELNCVDMNIISRYIRKRFTVTGNYTHLLPKLHSYNGVLALTISVEEIKKHIIK